MTARERELREALRGLLNAVECHLQWHAEQPYRAIVYLHLREARATLGLPPRILYDRD